MTDPIKAKIQELVPDSIGLHSVACDMDQSHGYVLKHETCEQHDITLAVVLRAIGKNNLTWGWQMRLMGRYLNLDGKKGENWDLEHDNYDQQSEECKQFIGSLLNV